MGAKAMDMVMVDMVKATDMAMAGMGHLAMEDTDIARADMGIRMTDMDKDKVHMAMITMETRIKMTPLAMITKKMSKTMMDIAMETVGTVRRADMAMETMDMAMEMVDMVTVKVDTNMETMDMVMEMVDTIMMVDMAPLMVDMAMAKMDTEEVTDIQSIQAQHTVIKVIPRVTHQDPRTVQKSTADTNDYFNQTSDF